MDTLIKNALLFDGNGNFPVYRDLAITGGKISAIEKSISAKKKTEIIDAKGLWLLPGMLDIHTHLDLEVEVNPGIGEAVRHGTTTVVVGNCSLGTAFGTQQNSGANANPVVDCFARVENIPKSVLAKCVENINWNNTADYLSHFKDIPLGPNIIPLIPHSMLRIEAMGLDAAVTRSANQTELATMRKLVSNAMEEGYAGLSIDSLPFHYLASDPYKEVRIPTQIANRAEIFELAEILRKHNRVLQLTPDADNPINTFKRLFWTSGRFFKKPLKISSLVALDFSAVPIFHKMILGLAKFLNSGLVKGHMHFQALSTNFRIWANGIESPLFEEIDSTRQLLACELEDREARLKLLNDPRWEAKYREDMARLMPQKGLKRFLPGFTFQLKPHNMKIEKAPIECWSGDTIADVLARLRLYRSTNKQEGAKDAAEAEAFDKMPPAADQLADFFLHCLKEYDMDFRWWTDIANTRTHIVKKILMDENTLPGFNDSGAHIASMAFYDGNLTTLKLAAESCLKTVAIAIKRLTKDPAQFFGVDTGEIKVGAQADLVLINPDQLRNYDTNQNRDYVYVDHYEVNCMVNRSDGVVDQVYINGKRVWENGKEYTEALGKEALGQVLRNGSKDGGNSKPLSGEGGQRKGEDQLLAVS